ncbi:hypothetical protein BOTBODRAFT_525458 [Botryobasidium botryosum FD-172 SS1]|uniref:Uncharacterized protein n=1 Tax=Botryobasidium botryosum (strain FD-172 SS1) TaxID=930990 RepID=A0A067M4B6_BOTB1|nr:hypothetical protein BOTBODRAFT_525458 [Botryobasidium botryosum FD-172 SS1]
MAARHQSAASKPGPRCPTQSQIPIFSPDLGFFPPHLTASSASLPVNQARREGVISARQSSIACCPGALHHREQSLLPACKREVATLHDKVTCRLPLSTHRAARTICAVWAGVVLV